MFNVFFFVTIYMYIVFTKKWRNGVQNKPFKNYECTSNMAIDHNSAERGDTLLPTNIRFYFLPATVWKTKITNICKSCKIKFNCYIITYKLLPIHCFFSTAHQKIYLFYLLSKHLQYITSVYSIKTYITLYLPLNEKYQISSFTHCYIF